MKFENILYNLHINSFIANAKIFSYNRALTYEQSLNEKTPVAVNDPTPLIFSKHVRSFVRNLHLKRKRENENWTIEMVNDVSLHKSADFQYINKEYLLKVTLTTLAVSYDSLKGAKINSSARNIAFSMKFSTIWASQIIKYRKSKEIKLNGFNAAVIMHCNTLGFLTSELL